MKTEFNQYNRSLSYFFITFFLLISFTKVKSAPQQDKKTLTIIKKFYKLDKISFLISSSDILLQAKTNNRVHFYMALNTALRYFLSEQKKDESPFQILNQIHPFSTKADLKNYINRKDTKLALLIDKENIQPVRGERVENNWIFQLSIPSLSDHLYWVVIPKDGRRASYLYGAN